METNEPNLTEHLRRALTDLGQLEQATLTDVLKTQTAFHAALHHEAAHQRRRGREARARAIERRLEENRGVLDELHAARDSARIVVPAVSEEESLIHGRVTSTAGRSLGDLTVQLVDRSGEPLPTVDSVNTDDNGYYALHIGAAAFDDGEKRRGLNGYLVVCDSDGRILHRSRRALVPERGRRHNVSVRLDRSVLRRPPVSKQRTRGKGKRKR